MKYALFLVLLVVSFYVLGQSQPSINYMTAIKQADVSKLWKAGLITTHDPEDLTNKETFPFPKPLGYIGSTYQRFYIHYTSVEKDRVNPYRYWVRGQTRVKNHICNFKGTITIVKAIIFKASDDPRYKQGRLIGKLEFKEDSSQAESGYITGQLTSNWCLDKRNHFFYDAINFVSDGYRNNQCIATWTNYKTHKSKPCNWGDFRMPNSDKLDIGAGEVSINPKYVKNGWQSYTAAYSGGSQQDERAVAEENREWWK